MSRARPSPVALATVLALLVSFAGCDEPGFIAPGPDVAAVQISYTGGSLVLTQNGADGQVRLRQDDTLGPFAITLLDPEGAAIPAATLGVEFVTADPTLIETGSDTAGSWSIHALEGGTTSVSIHVTGTTVGGEAIDFTAAPLQVEVLPLPAVAVLTGGGVTVTTDLSGADGLLTVEPGGALPLTVTLRTPSGAQAELLPEEALEVTAVGTGAIVAVDGDDGSYTVRAGAPGTDSLRVALVRGSSELVYAAVPVRVALGVCAGPTSGPVCLRELTRQWIRPTALVQAPGDDRLFVARLVGVVEELHPDGSTSRFLDIVREVAYGNEGGLLGIAFDPDFETNRTFYINYKDLDDQDVVLERWTMDGDGNADPASRAEVFRVPHDTELGLHNAGFIQFGPDGYLWITAGDGGSEPDLHISQDLTDVRGSVLRIDPTPAPGPAGYAVPAGNPFADGDGGAQPEIYYYGLRNPWRIAMDGREVYIADVGEARREELDVVSIDEPGVNFGWNVWEGTFCKQVDCSEVELVEPTLEYDHSVGAAIIGGFVYRGIAIPALEGRYMFADHEGFIRSVRVVDGVATDLQEHFATGELFESQDHPGWVTGFGVDEDGELYLLMWGGRVFRLEAAPASTP